MKRNKELEQLRTDLLQKGINELSLSEEQDSLRDVLSRINELKSQMNEAKIKAIEEAEKPYRSQIEELEDEYSFILKLMA